MKKRYIFLPIFIIAAGALVWALNRRPEFLYAGTVEATEVDVSARVGSVIASYDAKEGDAVQKDQSLARLACEDVSLEADIAGKDFQRAEELYQKGSLPRETYDRLKNRWDAAALKHGWCDVKSPVTGAVLETYHEAGEWVQPGTKLLTVADLSTVWASIYVPQIKLARLSVNQEVEALLPELDGRVYKGRIAFIRDEAEFTPKNVQTREERTRLVYRVKVEFNNPDGVLKPGMTLEVRLPK